MSSNNSASRCKRRCPKNMRPHHKTIKYNKALLPIYFLFLRCIVQIIQHCQSAVFETWAPNLLSDVLVQIKNNCQRHGSSRLYSGVTENRIWQPLPEDGETSQTDCSWYCLWFLDSSNVYSFQMLSVCQKRQMVIL